MDEMSREGHRNRAKKKLLESSVESIADYQLLECLLFYSIPRTDVKPIAYELINRFGTINGVLSASVEDLTKINGIGENSATLIKLSKIICDKCAINKNIPLRKIDNYFDAIEYSRNIVQDCEIEKFLIITLNNNMEIISNSVIAQGYSNHAKIEPYRIVERALNDRATSIIIAHNHPNGQPLPSQDDEEFTLKIIDLLNPLQIKLNDHIIVGHSDCCSMSVMPEYASYFKSNREYNYINE